MAEVIRMPLLSDTMKEGVIAEWHKKVGDKVKSDDVIAEVDGKAVNSTDEMVKVIRDSKEKSSVLIKLNRAGKTQSIEVKMPKKLKTADL